MIVWLGFLKTTETSLFCVQAKDDFQATLYKKDIRQRRNYSRTSF